jgi:hypothetical protein
MPEVETEQVMVVDESKLMALWNLDEIPACDEGVKLASEFLTACSRAVEQVGVVESFSLRSDFHFKFSKYAAHYEGCDKCNER